MNIGVIQIRLKHWTTATSKPLSAEFEEFYSSFIRYSSAINNTNLNYTLSDVLNNRTRHTQRSLFDERKYKNENENNLRLRQKNLQKKNFTNDDSSLNKNKDTFAEIIMVLWKKLNLLNSPLGYIIIAATFMLVALLAVIYAILTVVLDRRDVRDKYEEVQVVVVNNNSAEFNEFDQPQHYQRLNQNSKPQYTYSANRCSRTPGFQTPNDNSRSQTPKNSLNSLQRYYIDQYGNIQMSESEMERLYRSINSYRRYSPGVTPTITPSITSEESSTMRRVNSGNNDRNRRIKERLRRLPLEAPPPPPPPTIPPPPIPPHCKI